MSMNLTCSCFNVRQTPSYITYMILSYSPDGEIDGGSQGAARRYVLWCKYNRQLLVNSATHAPDEQRWIDNDWTTHITAFEAAMKSADTQGEAVVFSVT